AGVPEPLTHWPPPGATELDLAELYPRLAEIGFEYGPAFQGLTRAWQAGEEIYAEAELSEEQREQAGAFAIHPALLDTAFHAPLSVTLEEAKDGRPTLPFDWQGVSLFTSGASSLRLRVSLGEDRLRLLATDAAGRPAVAIESIAGRPVDPAQLAAATGRRALHRLAWVPPSAAAGTEVSGEAVVRELAVDRSLPAPAAALAAAAQALALIQEWLGEERRESRLVIRTEGAVATTGAESPDPAAAAIWGLVRSAQSEHPGRFCLLDSDGSEASARVLDAAL